MAHCVMHDEQHIFGKIETYYYSGKRWEVARTKYTVSSHRKGREEQGVMLLGEETRMRT